MAVILTTIQIFHAALCCSLSPHYGHYGSNLQDFLIIVERSKNELITNGSIFGVKFVFNTLLWFHRCSLVWSTAKHRVSFLGFQIIVDGTGNSQGCILECWLRRVFQYILGVITDNG